MNKNQLKEGEIYKVKLKNSISLTYVMKATKDLKNVKNIPSYNSFMKEGDFNSNNCIFEIATPEEKHWLETCIKKDKFITFKEAIKTFIPEYVEAIQQSGSYTIGKIYKTLPDSTINHYISIDDENRLNGWGNLNFKSSTKEAYEAQFVVKEPEFVLPEKWCIKQNISKEICDWFNKNGTITARTTGAYTYLNYPGINGYFCDQIKPGFTEITFEQFKKYVLKETEELSPLKLAAIEHPYLAKVESKPFEILSIVNNITKEQLDFKKDGYFRSKYSSIHLNNVNDKYSIVSVANQEGNVFNINDKVISVKAKKKTVQTIKLFQYSADKLKIQAVTTLHIKGININKLEHFIEIEPEFILPEKWAVKFNYEFKSYEKGIKWCNDNSTNKSYKSYQYLSASENTYFNYPSLPNVQVRGCISENHKEITLEQFKKYVLKETEIAQPVVEETLLDKAKKLYPVGTIVNNVNINGKLAKKFDSNFIVEDIVYQVGQHIQCNNYPRTLYNTNKWAEIIGYKPQIGDKFVLDGYGGKDNTIRIITKFQGSYDNPNSVISFTLQNNYLYTGTVLLKNIKIIK